jgi:methyl-accepting chemotaxis protein
MVIVNPIYDVAFKQIMENNRVAKFFIGTILNCEVIELVQTPQERIIEDPTTKKITLFRMDFAAKIKLSDGTQKSVIIELQKAKHLADITRFRRYLGKEYATSALPIISIYILGFDLSIDSPAFMARPDCWDLRTNEKLNDNDSFVENLTHTAYFIQTLRIKQSYKTKLDNLLSVFEQTNFVGDTQVIKGLSLSEEELGQKDAELKEMINILRRAAADDETLAKLQKEQDYLEAMEEAFGKMDKELRQVKSENEQVKSENEQVKSENEQVKRENEQVKKEKDELVQKNRESARKMKTRGMPVAEIAEFTELSAEEIEAI